MRPSALQVLRPYGIHMDMRARGPVGAAHAHSKRGKSRGRSIRTITQAQLCRSAGLVGTLEI